MSLRKLFQNVTKPEKMTERQLTQSRVAYMFIANEPVYCQRARRAKTPGWREGSIIEPCERDVTNIGNGERESGNEYSMLLFSHLVCCRSIVFRV